MYSTGVIDFLVWLAVSQVLAFAVLPVAAWMLPRAPDRGYGLSKIMGFLAFGLLSWILPALGIVPSTSVFVTLVFAVIVATGCLTYVRKLVPTSELHSVVTTYAWAVEGIFVGLSVLFAIVRFLNPEIVWGEKPMDSTFLHFLIRTDTLPPEDPWAAGNTMRYYYVGIYMVACIAKLTGIPASIAFNLAISTLAGLIGAGLFTIMVLLTKSRRFSAAAAPFLVLASDPEVLRICYVEGRPANFDTFWASTRVFTSPWFFEYTSWSLLFADLHAHVVAIPITVLVAAFGICLFVDTAGRYSLPGLALRGALGASWGALFGMNTWDFITFGFLLGFVVIFAPIPTFWRPPTRADGSVALVEKLFAHGFARLVAAAWDVVPMFIVAVLVIVPYSSGSGAGVKVEWGWATAPEFNTLGQVLRMLGYWLALFTLSYFIIIKIGWQNRSRWRRRDVVTFGILLAALLFLPLTSLMAGVRSLPWGIVGCSIAIVLSSWSLLWRPAESRRLKIIALMAGCAGFLITLLEMFFLIDRMNTLFKGYQAVWLLFGVTAMASVHYAWSRIKAVQSHTMAGTFAAGLTFVAGLSLIGSFLNMKAVVDLKRVKERFYTLDGQTYLTASAPEDYGLIYWFNSNVRGTPTILEAQGDSYQEFTRIAMHTGLPTVLGWEHHVRQRGLPHEALLARKEAVYELYSSPDIESTKLLLLRYGVQFVVVGPLERATYSKDGLDKFERYPDVFRPIYGSGASKIYTTYFSPYYTMTRGLRTQ